MDNPQDEELGPLMEYVFDLVTEEAKAAGENILEPGGTQGGFWSAFFVYLINAVIQEEVAEELHKRRFESFDFLSTPVETLPLIDVEWVVKVFTRKDCEDEG